MDIIIIEQSRSILAHRASNGADPLGPGQASEITLSELLEWLRPQAAWAFETSGDDIVISHFNQVGLEERRTTITCNSSDREEIIAVLDHFMALAT